jgi:glutamate 5-kinase
VKGDFKTGDVVELETVDGKIFGRGMVKYGSKDLDRIAGKKTGQIENILGGKTSDEIIHRNDLVIWSAR